MFEGVLKQLQEILFFLDFFFWNIIALQCSVSFCCTLSESDVSIHMFPPSWTSYPPQFKEILKSKNLKYRLLQICGIFPDNLLHIQLYHSHLVTGQFLFIFWGQISQVQILAQPFCCPIDWFSYLKNGKNNSVFIRIFQEGQWD